MSIIEDMLIMVNSDDNNNKFYYMKIIDNKTIKIKYGRVGTKGREITKYGDYNQYNQLKRSKIRKGYVESKISLDKNQEKEVQKESLLDLTMSQIEYKQKEVKILLQRLVDKNIHNITTNSKIKFNKDSNLFTTPLGPVTSEGINEANRLLNEISKVLKRYVNPINIPIFIELNEKYFKIIPTKIKNLREKNRYMLINDKRIQEQFDLCNTLEQTLQLMKTTKPTIIKDTTKQEQIFKISIDFLSKRTKDYKRIVEKFEKSKNKLHGNYINQTKIENIYKISLNHEEKQFRKDLNNVWELWHGTKVVNLLSIMKSGLLMPRETPGQTTGAMFGNGLYFSDQSTKSLNYCDGMYWNRSQKQDKIYIFLADVAMGNYQIPKNWGRIKPDKGFDSFFAKANKSGVKNNEMIVFNTNQIKLKYLLEIKI